MSSAILELRAAIVAALKADATLAALGDPALAGRIYARPRAPAVLPYVSFGLVLEDAWDTDGMRGSETEIELSVWSRAGGPVEAERIAARIRAVLHEASLTLATQTLVLGRFAGGRTLEDPDGETTRAVLAFRYLTQP